MRDLICQKLKEIEAKERVDILYAAESGSRAWGFASPDSDYDVRFIYLRRIEDYLKIDRPRDVIEYQRDETLDISGWDLLKALRLLRKSNPTLFEWSNSPAVYVSSPAWEQLQQVLNRYFSSTASIYHYMHMASGNYRTYLKGELVRVKKYLYVIRPILACKWILNHCSPPPMLFASLVKEELEESLRPLITALLEKKKTASEMEVMPRIDALNRYIEQNLSALEVQAKGLPAVPARNTDDLNDLFLQLLKGAGKHV